MAPYKDEQPQKRPEKFVNDLVKIQVNDGLLTNFRETLGYDRYVTILNF